ncbi:hypothetical protein VF14_21040 [Nostoc linckia z18]|uniref:Uncharacterized protein n=2 Tax=Nostoc linckia TaxID=92942 RepID=A0A9Q5ZAI9_NOSLI|nr:hypothetical protein VF02_28550 [Nostoc linckia z1]PHJ60625.1 hypothetical protein VF05_30175 [Nostoc linckia z3]PHJ65623.1 hypothetical protein VF03_27675 [Nostoc linckia z2]PHJ77139.1 hypothetical protein VF06_30520 [Nostoc linckia z4]PHJ81802.1 hypothetical protein VF07_29800 [Nostoc linckia z6]PHJ95518.1 hypothetical protein VF04_18780 [Nostoc linckia z7]PHK02186.1 hypothetical protein VF08_19595 [Nostoc linckia z8]PHK08775.1 hypothetical protein VF09_18370 [Nostoc linckia z9]PHK1923
MLIGWFGNQWLMDFNSFCQIELYLDKRILDWRFYILVWAKGKGERAKGKGERAKGKRKIPPFTFLQGVAISPSPHLSILRLRSVQVSPYPN